jgi:hypothetical protein
VNHRRSGQDIREIGNKAIAILNFLERLDVATTRNDP